MSGTSVVGGSGEIDPISIFPVEKGMNFEEALALISDKLDGVDVKSLGIEGLLSLNGELSNLTNPKILGMAISRVEKYGIVVEMVHDYVVDNCINCHSGYD